MAIRNYNVVAVPLGTNLGGIRLSPGETKEKCGGLREYNAREIRLDS